MKAYQKGICLAVATVMMAGCLAGCGETTVTVKNSLPQEFSAYDGETLASTITINDVQCSISDNTISVEVVGSCTGQQHLLFLKEVVK